MIDNITQHAFIALDVRSLLARELAHYRKVTSNMTVSAGDQATLYPHEPTSLLALLSQHLPYSSSVFGTIKTNSWPNFTIPKDLFLPDGIDGLDQEQIASVVWTTFPPEEVDDPPEIWAVIIHLPQPQRRQTRLYCSAQRTLHGTSSSSPTDPETSTTAAREVDNEEGVRREGQSVVDGMIKTFLACSPVVELLGGVSTLWTEEIWEYLGTERRPIYDSWLAPVLPITRTEDDWESRVNKDGLVVDKARKEDCPIVSNVFSVHNPTTFSLLSDQGDNAAA